MKKIFTINFYKFLSLFELSVSNLEEKSFYEGKKIIIYNKMLDPVGEAFYCNGRITIDAVLENSYLYANSFYDGNSSGYNYTIKKNNSNDKLIGLFQTQKGIKYDNIIVENELSLYKDDSFISKCYFSTLKNAFKILSYKSKQKVTYISNKLTFLNNLQENKVINENGQIYYFRRPIFDEKYYENIDNIDNIAGYKPLDVKIYNYDYTPYDIAIVDLINELDDDYYPFIEDQKELFNDFHEGLFESLACTALKNFNRKQLKSMLNINFSKFTSKSKVRK